MGTWTGERGRIGIVRRPFIPSSHSRIGYGRSRTKGILSGLWDVYQRE